MFLFLVCPCCIRVLRRGAKKNLGQGLSFLLHGVSVHQGFPGGIPVPMPSPVENQKYADDYQLVVNDVARFFAVDALEELGAKVMVEPYPDLAAKAIQMHLHLKRIGLGWRG